MDPERVKPRCATCGSFDVLHDANATWNTDTQEWEIAGIMDAAYCDDCDGETRLAWETIP